MALTRAQLLAGNQSNGVVLPGQPQGVIAGPGISISNTGIISVDSSSVTGLVKLNDPFAYNSYVWPGADGAAGEFLQTDGTGNLSWATPQGFAVVTVQPSPAPSPADIGELWFDCSTGTLNVYQNCVGSPSPNWFNVAQPGKPVDPNLTSASPAFSGGNGTQATPYQMTVTSTGVGTTVAIINTVTVNGLAPFQYVPIVDLNAVTNGGRFSFTNYYANSSGQLIFNTVFSDLPTSTPGQNYIAAIRVGYATAYIQASVSVTAALTLSQGTITGTPTVGTPVAYTPGIAAGGTPAYTYSYQWKANGTNIGTASSNPAFTPTAAQVGQTLSVVQTVTDSLGASVSNTTTASAQTATAPFPNATWGPTPANGMDTNPGGVSGIYSGTGTTITVSGCIESAVYTPPAVPSFNNSPKSITSGQTLAIRWTATALCGNANTNTTMNGTVSDGTYTNSYTLQINRVPAAIGDLTDTNVALGATVSKGINPAISGLNSVAYVTAGSGSTGTSIGVSLTAGGPFTAIPSAPSTTFPITNGQTLYVEQTVGGAVNTSPGYTAVVKVGDADGVLADSFTYFAQTVSSAVFPNTVFTPSTGPNATPAATNLPTDPLGNLDGTATTSNWNDGSPTLTATNMLMSIGVGVPPTLSSISPVPSNTVNVAWLPSYINGLAHDAFASGSFTDSTYTNTYTYQVKKQPANWPTPAITNAALSTQQTTGLLTPDSYNSPVVVTFTAPTGVGAPPVLSNVYYELNGGGQTLVTVGTTTVTINPGDQIEIFADSASTVSTTEGLTITMGSATPQTWTVATTAATPAIATPTITLPVNNAPAVNPATNTPAGFVTIKGDTYSASGGAGAQSKSVWEVYKNAPNSSFQSTATISAVAPAAVPAIGSVYGGGYFAGQISTAGNGVADYNLIVAPVASGSLQGQYGGATPTGIQWKTSASGPDTTAQSEVYGAPAMLANSSATFPMFNWCVSGPTGPNAGTYDATNAAGTGIGGFNDWYIPAKNELAILYFFLKPDGTANDTSAGSNPNSVAPYTPNTNYGAGFPNVTGNALFAGGTQAFSTAVSYWSASEWSGGTNGAWRQGFDTGFWGSPAAKNSNLYARAIRRAPLSGSGSYQVLSIAGADTDGFTVGMAIKGSSSGATGIITAINGTSVTITQTSATNWTTSDKIEGNGTAITGSPFTKTTGTLTEIDIAQAAFTTSSTYYTRVKYGTNTPPALESNYSAWSKFTTASAFAPAPGTAMGGGYFGGQINDGGIVYNLIVSPKATGENSSVQWKTSATADTPSALWENQVYGFPASQAGAAAGAGTYPAFHWARSLSISTYNDWYVPALNELEVLYYFLKPGTANNYTLSGSNPNAVAPEPISTNYTTSSPGPSSSSLFLAAGGVQAFSATGTYWSSSAVNGSSSNTWRQDFADGFQGGVAKNGSQSLRAIRREYANAPVAIGDAFGGGFFAGQYVDPGDGLTYNLIVAPRVSGSLLGEYSTNGGTSPASIQWNTTGTADTNPPSQNTVYGKPATDTFGALGAATYPMFAWCYNNAMGPNGNRAPGAGIGGFTDWYIPAQNELAILCNNLGPNWTVAGAFQGTNPEAFGSVTAYWSSTQFSTTTSRAWLQIFGNGLQADDPKLNGNRARAVRRQLA